MPKRKQTNQEETRSTPKKKKKNIEKEENPDNEASKPKEKTNKKNSEFEQLNSKTSDGRASTLKIVSWNCAGLRALVKKNGLDYIKKEDADIVCFQETKCTEKECPPEVGAFRSGGLSFEKKPELQYNMYFATAEKKGYSGTSLWTKRKPLKVTYGLGIEKHDKEGRLITAEYDKFYLVTSYVPNSGRGLVNLNYRMEWEEDMKKYLKKLEEIKPVIFCGDLNVAHHEIDIANPKSNVKNAGFTKEEREKFSNLLNAGFIDSYRHLNPETKGTYTFWTYMGNARDRNIGWRLDYFILSKSLINDVCDSATRPSIMGSDHCPIVLLMAL